MVVLPQTRLACSSANLASRPFSRTTGTQVLDYEADTGKWVVEWLEGTTKERDSQRKLPRLRIYFKAEDPLNFVRRVVDAHARREVRQKRKDDHESFELKY